MIRTFEPVAGVASAQGLDVSNYQGNFDWNAAKKAVPNLAFGVYRLTQGRGGPGTNSPDPYAAHNHAAIRDAGLHRGAYHFLDPSESGAAQARYFVDTHDHLGLIVSDMLWLDSETEGQSPEVVAACAVSFMNELEQLRPYNPCGVYTFINFAKEGNCAGLGRWPLWLAYPSNSAPVPPPPWVNWKFWQWGTRNGTDADAYNGTTAQLREWIFSFRPPPGINPVRGLRVAARGFTGIDLEWDAPEGATSYTVKTYWRDALIEMENITTPHCRVRHLSPIPHEYTFRVRAHPGGSDGSDAEIKATTR